MDIFSFFFYGESVTYFTLYYLVIICSSNFQDNPTDKDMNQGTLVIFNLDPSVSNEDLRKIFGAYGEVKEVRSFIYIC